MKNTLAKNYCAQLDIIKGIALIAVVLYHLSGDMLPYGYLGVEIFLVISGYLMMTSILRSLDNGDFSFIKQIINRVVRLWPLVIAVCAISLAVGYFMMLPDDFENLSQSVIASSAFMNNILAAITTKNYWDIVNVFKPLMHTWYLGVLMQAYFVVIALVAICNKVTKGSRSALRWLMLALTGASLVLFLVPSFDSHEKFYFLPFRLFEITGGALLALIPRHASLAQRPRLSLALKILCVAGAVVFMTVKTAFVPDACKLLFMVVITGVYVYFATLSTGVSPKPLEPLAFLGRNSLSVYLSHQCVVAFFYYNYVEELTILSFVIFVAIVATLSVALHLMVERPVNRLLRGRGKNAVLISCIAGAMVLCLLSGLVYLNAGVVRDVPELEVSVDNAQRGMHGAYCDIPYSWNKDFTDSEKVKVLVIGDSFGRDWANILNESEISDKLEISYVYSGASGYQDVAVRRSKDADFVFCALSSEKDISDFWLENIPEEKFWVVGHKNFGKSNGIIYKYRFSEDYHTRTQGLTDSIIAFNNQMKEKYGEHYVDMLSYVIQGENRVRVFTEDGRYISQDCRHLTRAGAQYYAEKIDLNWLIK